MSANVHNFTCHPPPSPLTGNSGEEKKTASSPVVSPWCPPGKKLAFRGNGPEVSTKILAKTPLKMNACLLKRDHFKKEAGSSSNHQFSGDMSVLGGVFFVPGSKNAPIWDKFHPTFNYRNPLFFFSREDSWPMVIVVRVLGPLLNGDGKHVDLDLLVKWNLQKMWHVWKVKVLYIHTCIYIYIY